MVPHSPDVLTADWTEANIAVKSGAKNFGISWVISENSYLIEDPEQYPILKTSSTEINNFPLVVIG